MIPAVNKCGACGGMYPAADAGGIAYYHVCPPIANAAYQPDPRLPAYDPRESLERDGHRDERPDVRSVDDSGFPAEPAAATILADGAGAAPISGKVMP